MAKLLPVPARALRLVCIYNNGHDIDDDQTVQIAYPTDGSRGVPVNALDAVVRSASDCFLPEGDRRVTVTGAQACARAVAEAVRPYLRRAGRAPGDGV